MERIELIIIFTLLLGLMFGVGWFGSVIYTYFFGKRTGYHKLIKELNQELDQAHRQNSELIGHYTQQEAKWQEEINNLKEENNDFLKTHRNYQDRIFYLEQKLSEEQSHEN